MGTKLLVAHKLTPGWRNDTVNYSSLVHGIFARKLLFIHNIYIEQVCVFFDVSMWSGKFLQRIILNLENEDFQMPRLWSVL